MSFVKQDCLGSLIKMSLYFNCIRKSVFFSELDECRNCPNVWFQTLSFKLLAIFSYLSCTSVINDVYVLLFGWFDKS